MNLAIDKILTASDYCKFIQKGRVGKAPACPRLSDNEVYLQIVCLNIYGINCSEDQTQQKRDCF